MPGMYNSSFGKDRVDLIETVPNSNYTAGI
jgi:hypothetical protein